MQEDFHYYATYCASVIAGYSHEESMTIAYSAQFVDCCSRTYLSKVRGPMSAATTQLQLEMMEANTDMIGLQDITRIWSSFHFLPKDLHADSGRRGRHYNEKYRLICGPNGDLLVDTVNTAKAAGTLESVGIAMHVLADTWAHSNFAGTPSLVINNTDFCFYELLPDGAGGYNERQVDFVHRVGAPDDLDNGIYTGSVFQLSERTIMNLGHGRAGHLPDYSFIRYRYMPAWNDYEEIVKDNPSDYFHAFCQMIYAMKYLRGEVADFAGGRYDEEAVRTWKDEIMSIITKRQLIASDDWKAFGEKLSGEKIDDFDIGRYEEEYTSAEDKDETFLGRFFIGAMGQKSMVTNKIYSSGNMQAGYSVEYSKGGFRGIRDFARLVERKNKAERKNKIEYKNKIEEGGRGKKND